MCIGNAQQRFGEAHHCNALLAAKIVGVEERVDAGGLVRPDPFDQGSRRRGRFGERRRIEPRLLQAFGDDLLLVRAIGAPQRRAVNRRGSGSPPRGYAS